jgi:F-type H+-transporting ATPase subunit delta
MDTSKIGVRYAKALFTVAQEKNITGRIRQDFDLIAQTLRENPDLPAALNNPVVQPSRKSKLIESVFEGTIHDLTLQFLRMVVNSRRESYLPDITRNFLVLYRNSRGLKQAHLVTAGAVGDATRNEMIALIKKNFNTEVELGMEVNPSIIGGFVLTVDDQMLDASVITGLRQVKRELSKRIR